MAGFHDEIMYAGNVDFREVWPPVGQMTTDGDLMIGNTAGPTKIKKGTIVCSDNRYTIGYSDPNITLSKGTKGIDNLGGDTGVVVDDADSSITAHALSDNGSTVWFDGQATNHLVLHLTDGNDNVLIGRAAGNGSMTGNLNYGLGAGFLQSNTSGGGNHGMGYLCMNSNTSGGENIAFGHSALQFNSTGSFNIAMGDFALLNSTGDANVGIGYQSLKFLTTGTRNLCVGISSGTNYTGAESSNLLINHSGVLGESNVIRIGTQGSGSQQQNTCFIAGITGATVTGAAVLCDASGQLGTIASSIRYKENVREIDSKVSILGLRPVEFNFKKDESKLKNYGLIAEEVHRYFPYLCLYNNEDQPESVKYHELPTLLLMEVQRLVKRVEELEKQIKR